MKKLINIKKPECAVCGRPMRVARVITIDKTLEYTELGKKDIYGIEITYACDDQEHGAKLNVEYHGPIIFDGEGE